MIGGTSIRHARSDLAGDGSSIRPVSPRVRRVVVGVVDEDLAHDVLRTKTVLLPPSEAKEQKHSVLAAAITLRQSRVCEADSTACRDASPGRVCTGCAIDFMMLCASAARLWRTACSHRANRDLRCTRLQRARSDVPTFAAAKRATVRAESFDDDAPIHGQSCRRPATLSWFHGPRPLCSYEHLL